MLKAKGHLQILHFLVLKIYFTEFVSLIYEVPAMILIV